MPETKEEILSQFQPYGDRVIVKVNKRLPREEIGGIVVPETVKNTALEGQIVALGPGKLNYRGGTIPIDLRLGDRVLVYELAGEIFHHKGEEFLTVEVDHVLGLIEVAA